MFFSPVNAGIYMVQFQPRYLTHSSICMKFACLSILPVNSKSQNRKSSQFHEKTCLVLKLLAFISSLVFKIFLLIDLNAFLQLHCHLSTKFHKFHICYASFL